MKTKTKTLDEDEDAKTKTTSGRKCQTRTSSPYTLVGECCENPDNCDDMADEATTVKQEIDAKRRDKTKA